MIKLMTPEGFAGLMRGRALLFGFAMVVGIVVGTYSTLFIAVPLVNWWYGRKGGIEAAAAAVPAKPAKKATA